MTDSQDKKYWRRWTAVVRKNHWRMKDCRLVPEAVRNAGEHHVAVWAIADKIAEPECRAVIPDDLRHACHVHACGRDLKHRSMSDQQFDRLLLLWGDERELPGLLIEPDHIASVMLWENPAEARRQNTIAQMRRLAPDDVIAAVALDAKYGDDWEGLNQSELNGLATIIRQRGARPSRTDRIDPAKMPF